MTRTTAVARASAGPIGDSPSAGRPERVCKDCPPGSKRPAPNPGPRCATHHRVKRNADRQRAAEARTQRVFDLSPAEYDAIYAAQGGRCIVCRRATGDRSKGAKRRLAVEHHHRTGLIRGLACGRCNILIGILGDDPAEFERVAEYLRNPVALAVIGVRVCSPT